MLTDKTNMSDGKKFFFSSYHYHNNIDLNNTWFKIRQKNIR